MFPREIHKRLLKFNLMTTVHSSKHGAKQAIPQDISFLEETPKYHRRAVPQPLEDKACRLGDGEFHLREGNTEV